MIKYIITILACLLLIGKIHGQRLLTGYKIVSSETDAVHGEFRRPEPTPNSLTQPPYRKLYLAGQIFEYLDVDGKPQILQRLSGDSLRLYRNLDLSDPRYYIKNADSLSQLTEKRINLELGILFSSCRALTNAMAYTKVKYKPSSLVGLMNQYADCMNITNPTWSRPDSIEFNLSFNLFTGRSRVQDQPFKDHSGSYNDIQFQGWGLSLTAFADRRIRLSAGLNVSEMSTTNPLANVYPMNNPDFNARVRYQWNSYEIPLKVAYNFHFGKWRSFAGLGGYITITDNLSVRELFNAPYLSTPAEVRSGLQVNDHFGFGGMIGLERVLGERWVIGLQYEIQRSQMDFNMVRIERNLQQQPPLITTYRISTLELFASATDMTKFQFTTGRLSISIKFNTFWKYTTFN